MSKYKGHTDTRSALSGIMSSEYGYRLSKQTKQMLMTLPMYCCCCCRNSNRLGGDNCDHPPRARAWASGPWAPTFRAVHGLRGFPEAQREDHWIFPKHARLVLLLLETPRISAITATATAAARHRTGTGTAGSKTLIEGLFPTTASQCKRAPTDPC